MITELGSLTLAGFRSDNPYMSDDLDAVVAELRLTREQQWSMHGVLIAKIGETNSRLESIEGRLESIEGRLEGIEGRLERVENGVDALGRYTVDGFKQVVERANALESAFVRFVELVREDRLEVRASISRLESRVEVLERGARRPRRKRAPAGASLDP
ncbi:MAG: hypothetical protein HYV07_30200 [Deltaproteobacteria bacterium]|nr:hypothetical protein [Deltaproteobacteria bacterium]